jgi:hypothetical protein
VAYELLKDGQVVHTHRDSQIVSGKKLHLTRGEVGYAGKIYETLPDHLVDQIEAGNLDDVWRFVAPVEEVFDEPEGEQEVDQPHGHEDVEGHEDHEMDFKKMSGAELERLVEMHAVPVKGSGAQGKVVNADMAKALLAEHGHE